MCAYTYQIVCVLILNVLRYLEENKAFQAGFTVVNILAWNITEFLSVFT